MVLEEQLAAGRAALQSGRWKEARSAFEAALGERETPEALDGLGHALASLGEYGAAVRLRERAFAAFRSRGETRYPAMLAAYWLAFEYVALYGNVAAASGWLERGKHLAEEAGDCPERGWVELACALAADDVDVKEEHVGAAAAIASRFGDANLRFAALAYAGFCLVQRSRIAEGMRRLDEAVAAAAGGEVTSAAVAGEIYCKMLLACEMTLDVRRAEQWTAAVEPFVAQTNMIWASGICRMHYGGILIAAGRWAEAEHELTTSLRHYDASYRALRSGSVVRLADLRLRQGRLEEGEQLLSGHEHDGYAVGPRARLHLARGETELAVAVLRRGTSPTDPCLPRAAKLSLLVEAHLAAGRVDQAETVGVELAAFAERAPIPVLHAYSAWVTGLVSAFAGDIRAVECLETAVAGFAAGGLSLEEARTRLSLARILASPEPTVAVVEAQAALATFDRLGAARDRDGAAAFLRSLGARGKPAARDAGQLSRREHEVLRLVGLGLTNPEIAARLFISRKTAAHHVSNVLAKLGLRNRAEAAAHAGLLLLERGADGGGE